MKSTTRTSLLIVSFLMFNLLIYLPWSIYIANLVEFTILYREFALCSVILFSVSVSAATALLVVLKLSENQRLLSVIFALSILLWLQGSLIVWQYGPLDGRDIEWDTFWQNGAIDTPLWIVILLVAVIKPAAVYRAAPVVSGALIGAQMVALFAMALDQQSGATGHSVREYGIEESTKFEFSDGRNVILIILDAFQSNVFEEIVQEDSTYAEPFDGFTYFRNALAGSNYTEISVPSLLTGNTYDNSVPRSEYLKHEFLKNSVWATLKASDFTVDVFPWVGWANKSVYLDESIASNVKRKDLDGGGAFRITEKQAKEVIYLIDLSIFRSVPHFLKRHIQDRNKWFLIKIVSALAPQRLKSTVSTDNKFETNVFVDQASKHMKVVSGNDTFKYFHLKGAHKPLTVNRKLEFTEQTFPFNKDNYVSAARANLIAVGAFLEKLQREGIYDESLILVLSDHGNGDAEDLYYTQDRSDPNPTSQAAPRGQGFQIDQARGIPLVLIKRVDSRGRLDTSRAPVSLLDVPNTILSELGIPRNSPGPSMFDVRENEVRTRYYSKFNFSPIAREFLGPIKLYAVDGDSWLDASWKVDRTLLPPN